MNKLQVLVNVLVAAFALAFFDGLFTLELNDNVYLLLGLIEIVVVIWIWRIVNK